MPLTDVSGGVYTESGPPASGHSSFPLEVALSPPLKTLRASVTRSCLKYRRICEYTEKEDKICGSVGYFLDNTKLAVVMQKIVVTYGGD